MDIRKLSFRHTDSDISVLSNISFSACDGEITAILGPNGSGKTTLFNCITGIWKPSDGRVEYNGCDLTSLSHRRRAGIIAVVPQEHEPAFPYTVFDAVLMGRAPHIGAFSSPSKRDRKKSEEAIELVGIGHLKNRPYTQISGGERQLALIARAIVQEAPVLILDEPTSHLDLKNQKIVLDRVHGIVKERRLSLLMTVHDPNLAVIYSDRVIMLCEGEVLSAGTPSDVINNENLRKMYGSSVTVFTWEGTRVVHPGKRIC
ncbi:MAG TPA: ABC transporter ATP-binding protein [Spirochaetota bacterium]|nr:ABC transporter ATP-binding protein [Spirochaetota bacterium]HPJ35779.1 ABC transporter ATP-binding protein [Spirochaetota bacterium]